MENIYLTIVLSPLIASVIAGFFGKQIGRTGAHTVTIAGVAISCALSIYVLTTQLAPEAVAYNETVYQWMSVGGISMEVGEHLAERFADRYVKLLCSLSENIVFSAATPGQGGDDHINEQQHDYWITKFEREGFEFNQDTSMQWRSEWEQSGVMFWFFQNLMIFQKKMS